MNRAAVLYLATMTAAYLAGMAAMITSRYELTSGRTLIRGLTASGFAGMGTGLIVMAVLP
jgi:hypothetical protein